MTILLFAAAYFLVFAFQIKAMAGFDFLPSASILFLPAGVKLLAMLSGRWHGLMGLYLGKLAVDFFLLDAPFTFEVLVVHPVFWILPAYVVLQWIMRRLDIHEDLSNLKTLHLIAIAMATSMASAVAMQSHMVYVDGVHTAWLKGIWSMAMGDVSGIALTLILIVAWRRRGYFLATPR